ncbi:conserved hypothetical protein [Talaromyces stipitatus ATCC 10500]|uniref:EthD domain-containing protein n=1 Tax=Talaromyces stipitatus (strain ATCC 10500 / CBS 375.48 / QM 6759 / NRRL 1006) TaxID=441959 RepID=B8MF02_TALSN|nr:uncharacterized protein TSTA_008960 [Talaromyces stipitatus ATCC 10500]EED15771.1 conserved hypothetical protein [Talaromyces stipitatus ATCC 10500]
MAASNPSRQLLCLTMLGYKKPGLTEEELCSFQVCQHSQLVCGLMEKYGVVRYSITHNAAKPMNLLPRVFDPKYVEFSDYDFIVQIIIPNLDVFFALKEDPVYQERVAMDHLNFADRSSPSRKTRMSLGYVHEIIRDGKVVYVDAVEPECQIYNNLLSDQGKFIAADA